MKHEDVTGQIGQFQRSLKENQSLLEKNPNGDVKITLQTESGGICFDSMIDRLSSTIQSKHSDYVFTNNNSTYEDMKIYNLWVRATPTDLIHQPLDENDYEAACLSTGLHASTMQLLQENLVLGSLHGNKERWGLLKFKTMGIDESGTFELIYTTQDGSGTGIDAQDKASELLPLAISALVEEDSSISVKGTNLDKLSERVSDLHLVHEKSKQGLSDISQFCEQLVAKLGETVETTRKGIKTEAEKLGLFSFAKKKKLLQAGETLLTKYRALVSNQQDADAALQAWGSVVNALEEIGIADKGELNQLSSAYKKASDLQEGYEEAERQSTQRLQAAKGGVTYLQTLSIA